MVYWDKKEERSQGSLEFLLMLGAVMLVVAAVITLVMLTAQGLGSSVAGQIDNIRDNIVIPGLVGAIFVGRSRCG